MPKTSAASAALAEAETRRNAETQALWNREQALLNRMQKIAEKARGRPDAKMLRLIDWIRDNLCPALPSPGQASVGALAQWNDRRVLIFTENREGTKRYLRALTNFCRSSSHALTNWLLSLLSNFAAGAKKKRPTSAPPWSVSATTSAKNWTNTNANPTN